MQEPEKALRSLEKQTGLAFAFYVQEAFEGMEPKSRHILAGNRLRMSQSVKVEPDFEWKEKLSWRQKGVGDNTNNALSFNFWIF
jgi:hypothetical protein